MAVTKVFFDVPNYGIPGLTALAREKRVRFDEGSFLMFVNRKRTRVKILFDGQTMLTYASLGGQEISLEEIKALPDIVKGQWFKDGTLKLIAEALGTPITSPGIFVKLVRAA